MTSEQKNSYTVKSKTPLKELLFILAKNGIEVPVKTSMINELVIEVTEDQLPTLEASIAAFITLHYAKRIIDETMETVALDPESKEGLAADAIDFFKKSMYWRGLTTILVSEHFTSKNQINVDSFMLFNMRGFKTEMMENTKNIVASFMDDEQVSFTFSENDNVSGQIFETIREQIGQLNLDWSIYENIHIRQVEDTLELRSEKGTLIDEKFLKEHIGGTMDIHFNGNVKPWVRMAFFLPFLCMLFPVKKVNVHFDIEKEIKEAIKGAEGRIDRTVTEVEFEYCNRCDRCDK